MAYLDRLRERPLEAGATTDIRNGANSCGKAVNAAEPVDGQPIARGPATSMGYEPMLQGLCCLQGACSVVDENALKPLDETLNLEPFALHYGDSLPDARMAFRLVGNEAGPVVVVLGGISAHRIVSGLPGEAMRSASSSRPLRGSWKAAADSTSASTPR